MLAVMRRRSSSSTPASRAVEAKEAHEQGWSACIAHFEALFS